MQKLILTQATKLVRQGYTKEKALELAKSYVISALAESVYFTIL